MMNKKYTEHWNFKELKTWDDTICKKAKEFGLDWHPINYEVCDYFEMIGHMSYHGMPSHYNHWSYGKSFEVTHQQYNMGMFILSMWLCHLQYNMGMFIVSMWLCHAT